MKEEVEDDNKMICVAVQVTNTNQRSILKTIQIPNSCVRVEMLIFLYVVHKLCTHFCQFSPLLLHDTYLSYLTRPYI